SPSRAGRWSNETLARCPTLIRPSRTFSHQGRRRSNRRFSVGSSFSLDGRRWRAAPDEGGARNTGHLSLMITQLLLRALDRKAIWIIVVLCVVAVAIPAANLLIAPGQPGHVPSYLVQLFGKYLTFAMLALALDLVWGYCGILSLGHSAFFALGGYA